MFKLLFITILALMISVSVSKYAFSQDGSTNESTVSHPGTPSDQPVIKGDPFQITVPGNEQNNDGRTYKNEGSTNENEGNTYKNEDNPYTINYEVYDNTGSTNGEKYYKKDDDTNGGTKYYKNEEIKSKQDRGLHKGWYKKGKHKGRQ